MSLQRSISTTICKLFRPKLLYTHFYSTKPLSDYYGWERGTPIDRFFIELFLKKNSSDIKGKCLEVKNDDYVSRFGGKQVDSVDILDINKSNPHATIYGDLRSLPHINNDTYDCIVLTQVLQYIDDVQLAIKECHRILKNKGVLLITAPSIARIDHEASPRTEFWRFTEGSMSYLLSNTFSPNNLTVQGWGNPLIGQAYWLGFAQEEIPASAFHEYNPAFICGVWGRAIK